MSDSSGISALRNILTDLFGRVAEQVEEVTTGLDVEASTWRPDPDANSIGWLLWHLTRIQDDHVADLAGVEQVWTAQGYADRFALPFDRSAHGYGHSSAEVAQVRAAPADLAEYFSAVHAATDRYLAVLTLPDLERVVDTRWDPPVTVAVRLVSVINDCTEHIGQAAYLRGMWERR